jgi:UDP-N-acetylmuramyl-tripeptide synthetase
MRLKDILKGIRTGAKVNDMEIKNISYSSLNCTDASLFVAVKGTRLDGHDFAYKAYKKGARAFIAQRMLKLPKDAQVVRVSDSRRALSVAAANFYKNPSMEMKVFGVVGTNGKTTTTYILESILKEAGLNPGVIGTINYRYPGFSKPAENTTPESLDMQGMMRKMRLKDVKSAVIEVSSHALHQGRTDGIYFDAGIFTNLTQDHLDYHLNMRNYFLSKRKFFSRSLKMSSKRKGVWAAVNIDDEYGMRLFREFKDSYKLIPFSVKKCAGVYLKQAKTSVSGQVLSIHTPSGQLNISACLAGEFNTYNILGAAALSIGGGIPIRAIKRGVENLKEIPGRLQKINTASGCLFIDYAHTPDALSRVIDSVKKLGVKRVITVFGCGGDRDRKKRAKMGAVSLKLSDISIITSDNPRSEDPVDIINEILQPFEKSGLKRLDEDVSAKKGYLHYVDREEAIKKAVALMLPGDAVIIAGKGHEGCQIIKDKKVPFDDMKVATRLLKQKGIKVIC